MECVNKRDNNVCVALKDGYCRGEKCVFAKTREKQKEDIEHVFRRLKSLPEEHQRAIADKYYSCKMVWRG